MAEAVLDTEAESEVLFICTARHTDERVLANRLFQRETIRCQGLKGKTFFERVKSLLQLPLATLAAARIIKKFKPHLVLGVGGYVTGPVLLAAKMMGISTCIHEQNSVPGMANRKLGSFVDKVFLSIPGSEAYFDKKKCVMTGNPVRRELVRAAENKKENREVLTLLVLGGSLGAHRVNTLMTGTLAKLMDRFADRLHIIHQTGAADEQMVAEKYKQLGVKGEVAAFFDDMARLYQKADLVVSRAGATSLAEMTVFNLPMILIPYPYAADNHQQKNGDYLVKGGAARMFIEKDLNEDILAKEIAELFDDKEKQREMAASAGKLAKPMATQAILDECEKMITRGSR